MIRLLFSALLFSSSLFAFEVDPNVPTTNIFPTGDLIENTESPLTLETVISQHGSAWKKTQKSNFDASFSESEFWFRTELLLTDQNTDSLLVVAQMPVQDYIDLWFVDAQGQIIAEYKTGDRLPLSSRAIDSRYFAFPVPEVKNEPFTLYMRFDSFDGMYEAGPLVIQTRDAFLSGNLLEFFVYGILYGGLIWIGSYNLLLYFSHRDIRFLKYAGYTACFVIFHFSFRGFAALYWWTDNPWLVNQSKPIAVIFVYVMLYVFATDMLNTKHNFPRSHLAYQILIASLSIPLLLAVSGRVAMTYHYLSPQALLVLVGMLYFAIRGSIKGDHVSKIFLAAWGILLASTIVYIFRILGWIQPSFLVYHAVDIGAGIESLLLAFALGEKLNQLSAEKDASNLKLLTSTWELNHRLEENVNARTSELKEINKKLIWTNLKLQQLSDTDPLTGLFNRRQFAKRFREEIARSNRLKHPLVFHIIDIDFFKRLNDVLGHDKGDQALQAFSNLLTAHWIRETDAIYRLGGEEFGILHPCASDSNTEKHVAEFFEALYQANIAHPSGINERLSVSIGTVHVMCDAETNVDTIYNLADAALYEAKNAGRNRMVYRSLSAPKPPATAVDL